MLFIYTTKFTLCKRFNQSTSKKIKINGPLHKIYIREFYKKNKYKLSK